MNQRSCFTECYASGGKKPLSDFYLKPLIPPAITESRSRTIKIKNTIFAIPAAPAAIPPKPNKAATSAITSKMIINRSMIYIY